jgi:hypothetical protein
MNSRTRPPGAAGVGKHEESDGQESNIVSEDVSEPTQADIQQFVESIMPRLKKQLTTPALAFDFLLWFIPSFDLGHEWKENGLPVLKPSVELATETPIAAAPPVAEQAAAVADTASVVM